ncbi:substrate-binding periplasmic protein [Pseudomonas sp. TTU2014-080ASC]|uniref:substrate-binding periplasmic protein n=1 Tax=Pseudomonas sp. TTU2014-080ASC TaxID=1729724 RepID=UPI0007187C18|nr:transporter substrate-binding domain-containing protein [Pseudomonas sp. TTU2014-080ASC]KRW58513.1 amino acid ABC transporter substrate-binding protein [Pseudomonas sp. TTU2014-080ASC]
MRSAVWYLLLLMSFGISAEEWKVLGDEQFAPYSFMSPDNLQPQGHDVELVKAVLNEAQVTYKLHLYPWERLKNLLNNGKATAAFPFADTPERRKQYELVGPIRYGRTVFVAARHVELPDWKTFADLTPYTIGQVRGYTYQADYDKAELSRNTHANTPQQLVSMLLAGRIDMIVGDQSQLLYWLKQKKAQDQVRVLPKPLVVMPRFVAFHKGDYQRAQVFSAALERLRKTGMLERFYQSLD